MRIAFIGGYGHHYLRAAVDDAACGVEAVAFAPGHADADETRQRFDAADNAAWYDDVSSMLDDFEPDVVNVGTVYAHNAKPIIEVLRRGLPVVSDKPIAASWDDLAAIRGAAGDDGVVLTEFDFRCRPDFRAAADSVRRGDIGDPVLATAQKSYRFGQRPDFYRRREDYGSTMLWVASHAIDALRFVAARPLTHVTAAHGNVSRPDYGQMEDHCSAAFSFVGGGTGLVHADFLRPAGAPTHGDDRLRIAGAEGVIEVRDGRCVLMVRDESPRDITDAVKPRPLHRELLAAALEGDDAWFGTAASLETAAYLLHARDAADCGGTVAMD